MGMQVYGMCMNLTCFKLVEVLQTLIFILE